MRKISRLLVALVCLAMLFSIVACNKSDNGGDTNSPAANTGGATDSPGGSSSPSTSSGGSSPSSSGGSSPANTSGGSGNVPAPETTRDTLNLSIGSDSGTLHPLGITGGFVGINYPHMEPLYNVNLDGSITWILATSMDPVGELERTLKIREGVTFSNGNPLTAEDVMFTMEECKANRQFSLNVKVVDFEKTKMIDDYTIDLWYTEFNASMEPGFAQMLIMDKESYDEVGMSTNPIGTGPYVVTEYVVNSHVSFEARTDYWGQQPAIKYINFNIINESAQIINALETGDIDAATVSLKDVSFLESLGYKTRTTTSGYPYVTLFSMRPDSPIASPEARFAICHSIDRQAIADIIFMGMSSVVDFPASHYSIDFEPRLANLHETYSIGYNPERAKELAEQSGLVGKTVRIISNGTADYTTVAEIIQLGLLEIGVNAEILNLDQATYYGTMMDASNFEIAVLTPGTPSRLACDLMAMELTFIPLGWEGPEADLYKSTAMEALCTFDEKERSDKIFEAVSLFVNNPPWYALCEVVGARAWASNLGGYEELISNSSTIFYQYLYFT